MSFDILTNTGKLDRGVFSPFRGKYIEQQLRNKFVRPSRPADFGTTDDDVVEISVYDDSRFLLHYDQSRDYNIIEEGRLFVNTGQHINQANLSEGSNYILQYNFFRNQLGSKAGFKLYVEQISTNRTELRIFPVLVGNEQFDQELLDRFDDFFGAPLDDYTPEDQTSAFKFVINFGNNVYYHITNWNVNRSDDGTISSVILKLYQPLRDTISTGDEFWINEEVTRPYIDRFAFERQPEDPSGNVLRGPNFSIDAISEGANDTGFQTWDSLLGDGSDFTTTQRLINEFIKRDKDRVELNIDFNNFENFVHFSSATERIENFVYKVRLLKDYQTEIEKVQKESENWEELDGNTYSNDLLTRNKEKISDLIATFDDYERWLYEADSDKYENTYPKDKYGKLKDPDSTKVQEWLNRILQEAERYDEKNRDRLANNIPVFIKENPDNDQFVLFIEMIGHFFDLMWVYIKHLQYKSDRSEDIHKAESLSKDLSKYIAKSFGFDLFNGFDSEDLYRYAFQNESEGEIYYVFSPLYGDGTDQFHYGDNESSPIEFTIFPEYSQEGFGFDIHDQFLSGRDVQKQIWRNVLNSIPHLVKTKGTRRAVSALLSCYGIPNSALTIKEYGGTKLNHIPTLYEFEETTHSLDFYGDEWIDAPWGKDTTYIMGSWDWPTVMNFHRNKPHSAQIRFRSEYQPNQPLTIFELEDTLRIVADPHPNEPKPYGQLKMIMQDTDGNSEQIIVGGGNTKDDADGPLPIFDGEWNTLEVSIDPEESNITLKVQKRSRFGNLKFKRSGSVTSFDYKMALAWIKSETAFIGGDPNTPFNDTGTFPNTVVARNFIGEIDNIKFWKRPLPDEQFDEHTLAPYKYDWKNEEYVEDDDKLYGKDHRVNRNLLLNIDFQNVENLFHDPELVNTSPNKEFIDNETTEVFARNYEDVEDYPFQFNRYNRKNFVYTIKVGAQAIFNDKIRLEDSNLVGNLSPDRKNEVGSFDTINKDSPRLGIFFSPQEQINKDILASIGLDDINQMLGDPRDLNKERYPDLDALNRKYWLKYPKPWDIQEFILYVEQFNKAFFKQVRKLVPARADLRDGLMVQPHILERNKYKNAEVSMDEESKSSEIDLDLENDLLSPRIDERKFDEVDVYDTIKVSARDSYYDGDEFKVFPEYRYAGNLDEETDFQTKIRYSLDEIYTDFDQTDYDNAPDKQAYLDGLEFNCDLKRFYRRVPYVDFNIQFINPMNNPDNYFHNNYIFFYGPSFVYGDPAGQQLPPYDNQPPFVGIYNICSYYSGGDTEIENTKFISDRFGGTVRKPLYPYERYRHYIYNREFRTATKRMKYLGVRNDSESTLSGDTAVQITFTSPDRIIVSPSDRENQGPILDVE